MGVLGWWSLGLVRGRGGGGLGIVGSRGQGMVGGGGSLGMVGSRVVGV